MLLYNIIVLKLLYIIVIILLSNVIVLILWYYYYGMNIIELSMKVFISDLHELVKKNIAVSMYLIVPNNKFVCNTSFFDA